MPHLSTGDGVAVGLGLLAVSLYFGWLAWAMQLAMPATALAVALLKLAMQLALDWG